MQTKRVLAIGIDPSFADLSEFPHLTVEIVRAYLEQQLQRLREHGHEVDACLIDLGETATQEVARMLNAQHYDCIVIGAGLREPAELLPLFEKVINLVHQLAPDGRIAFNTTPADTAEAALRWLG